MYCIMGFFDSLFRNGQKLFGTGSRALARITNTGGKILNRVGGIADKATNYIKRGTEIANAVRGGIDVVKNFLPSKNNSKEPADNIMTGADLAQQDVPVEVKKALDPEVKAERPVQNVFQRPKKVKKKGK